MRSVGLLPGLGLVAGAAAGVQMSASTPHVPLLVAPCALAIAVLAWACRAPRVTCAALLAGFFAVAFAIAADARDRALYTSLRAVLDAAFGGFSIDSIGPEGPHDPLPLRAVLLQDAAVEDDIVSLRARAVALRVAGAWVAVDGGVALSVAGTGGRGRAIAWTAGRLIEAPVTFRRPARYLDDGVPDQEREAALAGITLFGSVKSGLLVSVLARGSAVAEAAARVRAMVRHAIGTWVGAHDEVAAAIVTAVLIGDRTGLPDDVRTRLQAAGTYHVIAISGGNIAILAALVIGLLVVIGLHGRVTALLAIVTLVAYSLIVTAGPSVWRATLMAVTYLVARLVDHRTPPWHAIALAAGALVVWQPLDVRDAGFILTFGATAALLRGARLGAGIAAAHPRLAWVAASVAASLATELALMPVSAHTFSRVTCAGLALNLVAVPAMAVVQVAGMVAVAVTSMPPLAWAAGVIAWLGAAAIVESARLVDVVPWLTARTASPALWVVAAYYAALAGVLIASGRRRGAAVVITTLAGVAIASGVDPARLIAAPAPPLLRLTVFDVGQGDAMLLQAGGRSLMVDTGGSPFGGSFDIGGRVLAPALWARGVRSLSALLVTHGDPDHIGGALEVVDDFAPGDLWLGVPVAGHAPSEALAARAARHHIPIDYRYEGQTMMLGAATVRVLNPPMPDWERRRVRNDDSVVLEVTRGDVALLLTGDIGADVERAIVPQLTPARVRILKVAHHGSRTSSSPALLAAWRPQIAVISVGRGNRFGHPTPEVIERLAAVGARIYRTDRDGEVTIDTDGEGVTVRTFVGGDQ
jgi:competence protein ComEC